MERYNDADSQEHQEPQPTSRIDMSGDGIDTTVTGFGRLTLAVQGGRIIRHTIIGSDPLPSDSDGVQHPTPGVEAYGDDIVVQTYPETPQGSE